MKYYLLNVFTKNFENGNQLAAVFPEKNLSEHEMLSISKNFNFSETIFFDPDLVNPKIRIFTPKEELSFAGHPTVGASWLLGHLGYLRSSFSIEVPLGKVSASVSEKNAFVIFPANPIIKNYQGSLSDLLHYSQVSIGDVLVDDVRNINVGPEFTVIPLKNIEALSRSISPVMFNEPVKAYFICQTGPKSFSVRMFAPAISVVEDAATGSAACALGAFLRDVKGIQEGDVIISQGLEMGRECEIRLSWKNHIEVGGQVKLWASGTLS